MIFDFDGTIADTMPFYLRLFNEMCRKFLGHAVSREALTATFSLSEERMFRVLVPDHWREAGVPCLSAACFAAPPAILLYV